MDPENRAVQVFLHDGAFLRITEEYGRKDIARVNVLDGCFVDLGKVFLNRQNFLPRCVMHRGILIRRLNHDTVCDGEQRVFLVVSAVLNDRPRRVVLFFQRGVRGLECSQRLSDSGL